MPATGNQGIDVRQSQNRLVFRALLQDSTGAILTTGTTTFRLYEVQDDGTLKSYDFSSNTFKTTALTTETLAGSHRQGNNATTNTGVWSAVLSTLTGFTVGAIYIAQCVNTGASPAVQAREFQFGSAEGDLLVGSAYRLQVDAREWLGTALATPDTAGFPKVTNKTGTGSGELNLSSGAIPLPPLDSPVQHSGTAQAGASSSITLAAGASSVNDYYKGSLVKIYSGVGSGQSPRTITAYNGTTKVATVGRAWATNPDNTSIYAVLADQSAVLSANLGITLSGYEASQDPATLLLVTPANKLTTDGSGAVPVSDKTGFSLSSAGILAIWHQLVSGIVTAATIGKLITDNLNATITSRLASGNVTVGAYAGGQDPRTLVEAGGGYLDALNTRITSTRATYLDKLNVSGNVASQADINALNQSASRRILQVVVPSMERPESGNNTYTVEVRLFDADGAAINADATPTISPVGKISGSLSANLGALSNPATGVYRATYTVGSGNTLEEVRFEASALVSSEGLTLSTYSQVADYVSATFTATDRADIQAAKTAAQAAQTRVELGIPAAAPSASNGLPLKSDLPAAPDNTSIATLVTRIPGVVQPQTGDSFARLGLPVGASHSADVAAVKSDSGGILGKLAGITLMANWLRLLGRKSTGDTTALTEFNTTGGTYDPTTDSTEAVRDRGDAAWTTGSGGGGGGSAPTVVEISTQMERTGGLLDQISKTEVSS